jgi:hypothetical protein
MAIQGGAQVSGDGMLARVAVERKLNANHLADIGTRSLTQDGIELHAVMTGTGRYKGGSRGLPIDASDYGNVFVRSYAGVALAIAGFRRIDGCHGGVRNVDIPQHPNAVNCPQKFFSGFLCHRVWPLATASILGVADSE